MSWFEVDVHLDPVAAARHALRKNELLLTHYGCNTNLYAVLRLLLHNLGAATGVERALHLICHLICQLHLLLHLVELEAPDVLNFLELLPILHGSVQVDGHRRWRRRRRRDMVVDHDMRHTAAVNVDVRARRWSGLVGRPSCRCVRQFYMEIVLVCIGMLPLVLLDRLFRRCRDLPRDTRYIRVCPKR